VTTSSAKKKEGTGELRGEVLEVVRALLTEGRSDEVLGVVSQLVAKNSELTVENAELERRLTKLLAYRRKNEGISTEQLLLFLNELTQRRVNDAGEDDGPLSSEMIEANTKLHDASKVDDEPEPTTRPKRQPALRKPLPEHFPRVANVIRVPEGERLCPECGSERTCIGHDVTEIAELVPAHVIVRRDMREKLACEKCDGELTRAPVGDKVVPGGRLGPQLVSVLLVDKYSDGLPLHRQKERFARMGLFLSVSTLADQVTWSTDLLRPLWRAAIAEVLSSKVMHLDATGLPVLDREAAGGKRLGSLWGYVGNEDVAAYLYTSTGSAKGQRDGELGPAEMLALRSGFTVADASNIFDTSFKRDDLIECGCNMHARRYFVKALDAGDTRAALPLAAYKKLYVIESELRELDAEQKLAARRERSRPVFDELVAWSKVYQPHEPPASLLGAAIRYLTNHQLALARFLDAGEVPIDNGIVERLHVRAALTRKNFLFAGSDAGGDRAAIAFTILSCCRLAAVNPVDYLADVLPRLARKVRIRDLPALLPARWMAARLAT
jgi:transposase